MSVSDSVRTVFDYHQATKHHFNRYARGPGRLDWSTQPDPFRRYRGAPLIQLDRRFPSSGRSSAEGSGDTFLDPAYDLAFTPDRISPAPLDLAGVSRLLFDSLALSAWKSAGGEAWALRVNPSSGNLHPTEGYVICGPLPGLDEMPVVCHYAPKEHALELRARIPLPTWEKLSAGLPREALLIGLTSIHWREAWKYGERAYRYSQLDVGHALGALSIAAGGLGRKAKLLDDLSTDDLGDLLGVTGHDAAEAEVPECLLAVYPPVRQKSAGLPVSLGSEAHAEFRGLTRHGEPNALSPSHVSWKAIEDVTEATRKPLTHNVYGYGTGEISYPLDSPLPAGKGEQGAEVGRIAGTSDPAESAPSIRKTPSQQAGAYSDHKSLSLRHIIHQRRSAVAMDGITYMSRDAFYGMLSTTLPFIDRIPFLTLPWSARVHPALFVHRVQGLDPGLYFLVRNSRHRDELRAAMRQTFEWRKPDKCPEQLPLYLLDKGDARKAAMQISCFQDIAGEGCFSVAMIAEFESPLLQYGAWFYPRLFWECGMVGQVLYLEAEAAGLRGTGIGCFFDDPTHDLLGLRGKLYQDLYHFTIGGPVEDRRITTLPAYPG